MITICLKKKTSDAEKSAVVALTSKLTDQITQTAAYQGQLGYKIDSKEVNQLPNIQLSNLSFIMVKILLS